MAEIGLQKDITVDILTPEDFQKVKASYELGQTLRSQQMNLHLRPISQFIHFSVKEKRQALIEWN